MNLNWTSMSPKM